MLAAYLAACAITVRVDEPVPVRNAYDEKGKPQPLATVAEPTITYAVDDSRGSATHPAMRTEPDKDAAKPMPAPKPQPGFDWGALLTGVAGIVGIAGGGWAIWAQRGIALLRTALVLTAQHADRMENAETDEDVRRGKTVAASEQSAAGVRAVIARHRGKARA